MERLRNWLIALAILALALSLRVTNARTAIVDGIPRLSPFDELYHLKRIAFFPGILERDSDRGVAGKPLWCPWPPLYDLTAGAIVHLTGARSITDVLIHVVWIPPIVFALFAAIAALVVTRARGAIAGALTGFTLATSPFLVHFSSIGSIDHHWLEPPLAFAIACCVVFLIQHCERGCVILLGIAMTAAMFVQVALLVTCGLAFAVLFVMKRRAALAFVIPAMTIALFRLTRAPDYPNSEWFLGWPHAALFAGAALAIFLRVRRTPVILALAAAGALVLAIPTAAEAFIGGSHFFGGDPWLRTISEFLPVLGEPAADFISDIVLLSGGLILVWLLAMRRNDEDRTIAFFAIVYLLLDLSSRRFRPLAISFLALAASLYVGRLFEERRRFAVMALLLVALPPPIQLATWPIEDPLAGKDPWLRASAFFHAQTPGGRILAPWGMGHFLDVIAGRPVIVDNFGSMPDRVTFERAHDAFLATNEEALTRFCDAAGVRWIVFDNPVYDLPEAAAVTGRDPARFVSLRPNGEAARITRLAQATCWWRAYFYGGAAHPEQGLFGKPLTQFRLVYTDPDPSWRGNRTFAGPAIEIWERSGQWSVVSGQLEARPTDH
jgi:asparagine N-glycosylation enzyme membrane subunit Stt3